jgi:hypothetical protein
MKKSKKTAKEQAGDMQPRYVILALAAGPLAALLQAFIGRGGTTAGGINILLAIGLGVPLGLVGFYLRARRRATPAQRHSGMILLLVSVFLIIQAISYPLGRQFGPW